VIQKAQAAAELRHDIARYFSLASAHGYFAKKRRELRDRKTRQLRNRFFSIAH
jgi:hypothetical protein